MPDQTKWRVGLKLRRTLYAQSGGEPQPSDIFLGLMESESLAAEVVAAVNGYFAASAREAEEYERAEQAEERAEEAEAALAKERERVLAEVAEGLRAQAEEARASNLQTTTTSRQGLLDAADFVDALSVGAPSEAPTDTAANPNARSVSDQLRELPEEDRERLFIAARQAEHSAAEYGRNFMPAARCSLEKSAAFLRSLADRQKPAGNSGQTSLATVLQHFESEVRAADVMARQCTIEESSLRARFETQANTYRYVLTQVRSTQPDPTPGTSGPTETKETK